MIQHVDGAVRVRGRLGPVLSAVRLGYAASPGLLLGLFALHLLQGLFPVAGAWLGKILFDELAGGRDIARLAWAVGGMVAIGILAAAASPTDQFLSSVLRRSITVAVQERLFATVNRFAGLRHFEDPAWQDRLRLAQDAGQRAPQLVLDAVLALTPIAVQLVGFAVSIAVIWTPMLGLLALAAVPVILTELALSRTRAALTEDLTPTQRRQSFYQQLLVDVRAAKEIRIFGTGAFLHGRMVSGLRTAHDAESALDGKVAWRQAALGVVGGVVAGAALLVAVRGVIDGHLTLGDVALFIAAVGGVQAATLNAAGQVALAHGALLLFQHYLHVVDAAEDLPQGTLAVPPLRRGIEFRDVWFRYGDDQPWVLRGVTMTLPAGASVGLVGVNGAGKSTVVKLLCRFYDPQRGEILWDGVDLRHVPTEELRQRITAVFQDYMCYDLTARENIALGDLSAVADDTRLRTAASLAEADRTVIALPRGYETMLSRAFFGEDGDGEPEHGVTLSGGQWQRLALARTMLRSSSDLMILDEPSSGLDAEAEHRIHTTLRQLRSGKTSVLVSHRLSALRDADAVVVLSDGRVVERGSHAELIAAGGEYARLFALQASGYQDVPMPESRPFGVA